MTRLVPNPVADSLREGRGKRERDDFPKKELMKCAVPSTAGERKDWKKRPRSRCERGKKEPLPDSQREGEGERKGKSFYAQKFPDCIKKKKEESPPGRRGKEKRGERLPKENKNAEAIMISS